MKIFPDKQTSKAKNGYQSGGVADARKGAWVYTGGMGNYYGTAQKAPVGKLRSDTVGYRPVSQKQLGTPPKGVV